MLEILGLLLPWLIIALFWRPGDGVTSWRYYIVPGVAAAAGLLGVFTTDAQNTPDFWIGFSASLAAIAAAALVLIIQSLLPLGWWVRDEPRPAEPPADQAA